jgi:hypothetical protein
MAMTDPVPELATQLTLADEVPVRPASPSPGPGDAGCCPGSPTPPPVPAGGPVPGSRLVPGSGSLVPAGEQELPELGLGSRKPTAWEWLVQVLGHWTGLYAATVKKRRENPPPESLREHVRWAMAGGWNAWLPEGCVRSRKVLGFVEGPYQFMIAIPVHAACESVRKAYRYSVFGLPALGLVIYVLVRVL